MSILYFETYNSRVQGVSGLFSGKDGQEIQRNFLWNFFFRKKSFVKTIDSHHQNAIHSFPINFRFYSIHIWDFYFVVGISLLPCGKQQSLRFYFNILKQHRDFFLKCCKHPAGNFPHLRMCLFVCAEPKEMSPLADIHSDGNFGL